VDITDLYAFQKPGDDGKSTLILDVHPSFGVNPPGPTDGDAFAPEAIYEIKVDTNDDLTTDVTFRARFTPTRDGQQQISLFRIDGSGEGLDDDGSAIFVDAPVSLGREAQVSESGDYRLFAGRRSDPFFADVPGALNGFQFTGDDFFTDKDVSSIVLEFPNQALGNGQALNLWARVLVPSGDGASENWTQVDRIGHPGQVNAFMQGEQKVVYNAGTPNDDRSQFHDAFMHVLQESGGYSADEARGLTEMLLPDVLRYDHRQPAGFPVNGRSLTDDTFDLGLSILLNRPVSDGVGPHRDIDSAFPYLGSPHGA
jgi:hypothetical protein